MTWADPKMVEAQEYCPACPFSDQLKLERVDIEMMNLCAGAKVTL